MPNKRDLSADDLNKRDLSGPETQYSLVTAEMLNAGKEIAWFDDPECIERIFLAMKVLDPEYERLRKIANAALGLCNGGIDEDRPDKMHLFDADLVKALNDALDAWEEAN